MSFKYVVQVNCTTMGWVNTKHGGDTPLAAEEAKAKLLANDSAWVMPSAPRQARIRPGVTHG